MLTGVWAAERVRRMNPDFSWRVVSYPVLEEGAVLVINPDVRQKIYGVLRTIRHPFARWQTDMSRRWQRFRRLPEVIKSRCL